MARNTYSPAQIAEMAWIVRDSGTQEITADDGAEIVTVDYNERRRRWEADCIRYRTGSLDRGTGFVDVYEDREESYTAPSLYVLVQMIQADCWNM